MTGTVPDHPQHQRQPRRVHGLPNWRDQGAPSALAQDAPPSRGRPAYAHHSGAERQA